MSKTPETQELSLAPVQSVALAPAQPLPSPAEMLHAVISKGVTSENVAAVEQIVKLYEHMEARNAEKAFARAFNDLQAEMPKIQATKAVPNNDGGVRYKFAPFEDLMAQVSPLLQKHGFTVSFSSRYETDRFIQTCTLQHIEGHKRSNDFAVRVGQGPPKATPTQADGAAATYAKRFALTDALNIVIAHLDDDARAVGGPVTPEQAFELERRAKETNSNIPAFLKFAGATKFADIPAGRYDACDQMLRRKEGGK